MVKTTIANLSSCLPEAVAALRMALRGGVPREDFLHIERSLPHGHVEAVLGIMRDFGMDQLSVGPAGGGDDISKVCGIRDECNARHQDLNAVR